MDTNKDQTYFLHAIDKEVLKRTLFPIGSMDKEQVRQIARENSLITSEKKDSTGICFIGERPFPEFISKYVSEKIGKIVDEKLIIACKEKSIEIIEIQKEGKNRQQIDKFLLGNKIKKGVLLI